MRLGYFADPIFVKSMSLLVMKLGEKVVFFLAIAKPYIITSIA